MPYYNKDLYHHIIEGFAEDATDLHIISGYGSYSIAEHILKSYPHLNITLFIGMTSTNGISEENHKNFIRLVNQYKTRLNVYYQITQPSTHIKLYTWSKNDDIITNFLGSANFTENGLFKLNELMVESSLNYNELFVIQTSNSVTCTNDKVYDSINIYEESIKETELEIKVETSFLINETDHPYTKQLSNVNQNIQDNSQQNNHLFFNYRNLLRSSISSMNKIEIPVVLKNVKNYDTRGINQRFRNNQLGYLMKSNRYPFKGFFPLDKQLKFYTDDNKELKGIIYETQIDNLIFEDDIYQYFFNRLDISKIRPIHQADLDQYGRDSVTILKLGDTEYLFDFSKYN